MFSVNNLRLGTITATDYCLGSVPVQKMYLGSALVFDRTPAEEVRYFFEVSPTSDIEFEALDSEKTLTVTSYSQVYSGDTPSGSINPVTPTIYITDFITTDSVINNNDGTFPIILKVNDYYQDEDGSLSERNGTITVSLSLTGDSTKINVSQSPTIPTVLNRWLRLEYAAEEDQYITVNKANVELPYVSDWKNYVFPKKSTGIKPIRWNAEITNQDFMHEVLAYISLQTIVYVDEVAQENKSTYTAADSMCIATSNGYGLYFLELLKGSGILNGEITFKIDGNGFWGQFYKCFDGCSWNKVTIQFMQDNIRISSMNGAFRGCIINELNILDANGDPVTTKHFAARDLSGMCEWTYIDNFPDIIDWEVLDQNLSTGFGWAFSYAIPLISVAQHGSDREASGNTVRCSTFILAFLRCSSLQSIGPVLDLSRVPGLPSDNSKAFEQCTALTDVRIRNLNGPTWHFDDDTLSGNIPNLDQASVTYLFDNLMDLTTYNAEDTSGTKPKSDHGDLYCPAEWQDKITSEMIIAAAAKNWNIYIGGELLTVGDTKYTFTVPHPTINIPAEAKGGYFTLSWESYKQDVVNGEVQDAKTKVGVVTNSLDAPDWIQLSSQEEGELGNSLTFNFSDNTTASERSYTFELTQQETSDTLTVVVTQAAADIETTYTWNVNPTTVTIDGTDTATINVTSYKQQWIGDIQLGSPTPVDFQYTNPGLEESIQATKVDKGNGLWTITLSGGSPSVDTTYLMVFTADEGDNTTTVTVNKVVAGRNYSDITITEFTYPDIAPASGSTLTPTLSYTQSWGYGDSTTDGGTITSDATLLFAGGAVNASNGQYTYATKGTELSELTDTQVTVTVSLNGKTKTATANASQAANQITDTQYGEYELTVDPWPTVHVQAAGDTVHVSSAAYRSVTNTYTSGATSESQESGDRIFKLSSNQTWANIDGYTIVVAQNSGIERSATITVTSNGVSKLITLIQASGQEITSYGDITINGGNATDIPASGGTVKASGCTASIQVTYSSGETGSVTVPIENITYTEVTAPSLGTTVKARTKVGTSICNVSYQGKSASKQIDVYQSANTATYTGLTIVNPQVSGDIPASGGSMSATYLKITVETEYSSGETSTDEVIPSEANILSTKVTAASLGTTEKVRTKVGTSTISASYGGLSTKEDVDVYQQANVKTEGEIEYGDWLVDVSVNPNTIDSAGGTRTINRTASRTRTQTYNYTSGSTSQEAMSNETGTPTLSSNQTWCTLNNNNATIARNDTTSSRTVTITGTYQSKSDTCTITQSARQVESYGDINISGGSVSGDIPASGGSKSASGCTATIRVNYDNDTYENVSVPSSNISYSSVSGSNLGTTSKARTKVGTSRCTVSYQGKTATKNFDVYQLANSSTATDIDYGTWQVSVSANPTSVAVSGGTSTITRSATRTRKQNYTWTSGATSQSDLSNETATPTLSVSGTGFSLNGTTVTATSNVPAKTYTLQVSNPTGDLEEGPDQELTTTVTSTYTQPSSNSRSCTVTATHGGVSKQVTISLSGLSQSSGNQDWTVAKGTNMLTATKSGNTLTMIPNAEYGNKNETYTAQCTVTQTTSNKTQIVLGRWYKGYLNVSPATLDFTADGGTETINIDTNLNWQVMP